MSYCKLDTAGEPIRKGGRSRREEATKTVRGVDLFHYRIVVAIKQGDGTFKNVKRHAWLPDDVAAAEMERSLKHEAPVAALTWQKGFDAWSHGNAKLSPRHMDNVSATMERWTAAFGANKTIEKTDLGEFTTWIRERSKTGKGRGALMDQAHLLAIARWCRKHGLVKEVPFEHAPKPEDRTGIRRPATVEEFHAVTGFLPPHIALLWRLVGYTGMRLGASCGLLEKDIGDDAFTVTTKGNKRVTYPITAPIREIIDQARAWKAEQGFADKPYLFCNTRGATWTSQSVGRRIMDSLAPIDDTTKKRKPKEGAPVITAHQLRHMAGTILGEKNIEVPGIMAALGHANPASTQVYVDKTQKMRNEAMHLLVKNLSKNDTKTALSEMVLTDAMLRKMTLGLEIECPCCRSKLLLRKKKKAQPE